MVIHPVHVVGDTVYGVREFSHLDTKPSLLKIETNEMKSLQYRAWHTVKQEARKISFDN
jgi:hypothetical protein